MTNCDTGEKRHKLQLALKEPQKYKDEIAALLSCARSVIELQSFEQAARAVFDSCKRLIGAAAGYVALLSSDGTHNEVLFTDSGGLPCDVDPELPMPIRGMRAATCLSGKPQYENHFATSEWAQFLPAQHCPLENVLFAPLIIKGKVMGLLGLANKPGGFGDNDARLAQAFGDLAAVALANSYNMQELRRYAREQAALYAVSSVATSLMDPQELLAAVLDVVLPLFSTDVGWVTLPGPSPEAPPFLATWRGIPESFVAAVEAIPSSKCPLLASLFSGGMVTGNVMTMDSCHRLPPEVLASANLHSHVGVSLSAGGHVLGVLHIAWREPHPYLDSARALALTISRQVSLALYNAQLYQAACQVDRLRALNELDAALAATLDPATVQEICIRQLAKALNATMGALFVLQAQGSIARDRVFTLSRGWLNMPLSEPAREFFQALLQRSRDCREPLPISGEELTSVCPSGHSELASRWGSNGIFVPIPGEGGVVAAMILGGWQPGHSLTTEDITLAQAAASRAGQAVENALLFEAVRQQSEQLAALSARLSQVEEAERQHLARELHDQVGQNLTALGLNLNLVRMLLPESTPEQVRDRLDDSLALLGQTADTIRGVMAELRPPILDDYGLVAALQWYGDRFSSRTGIGFSLQGTEPTPRLAPAVETALFRITQEALNNVTKHSHASQVSIILAGGENRVHLTIADDGSGFEPGVVSVRSESGGWGLLSMRERAAAVGGVFSVEAAPGRGTRVVIEVPR
ncbi:MAG: GAF domain-containing sensor histidine kinase [Anaerolineae bacterium]